MPNLEVGDTILGIQLVEAKPYCWKVLLFNSRDTEANCVFSYLM